MNVENPTIESSIPFLCGQPSAFGLILVATAALAFLAFLIAVPDLVYSQRVGTTVGVLEILRMGLRFRSARPEIDVRRVLNLASRDCNLATITEVTRTAAYRGLSI
jgi:hypothetical protein